MSERQHSPLVASLSVCCRLTPLLRCARLCSPRLCCVRCCSCDSPLSSSQRNLNQPIRRPDVVSLLAPLLSPLHSRLYLDYPAAAAALLASSSSAPPPLRLLCLLRSELLHHEPTSQRCTCNGGLEQDGRRNIRSRAETNADARRCSRKLGVCLRSAHGRRRRCSFSTSCSTIADAR